MNSSESPLLKIGAFAELAGTNLRTLRYYEELGLLQPSRRSSGGFRYYRASDVHRLALIRRLQDLGLPLERIAALLPHRAGGDSGAVDLAAVRQALREHAALIERRRADLEAESRRVQDALARLDLCSEPCERSPDAGNDWCHVCARTGCALPDLLAALF